MDLSIIDYSLLLGVHLREEVKEEEGEEQEKEREKGILSGRAEGTNEERNECEEMFLFRRNPFRSCEGGLQSPDGSEIYYMGIIDILTSYDGAKKRERFVKTKILWKDAVILSLSLSHSFSLALLLIIFQKREECRCSHQGNMPNDLLHSWAAGFL